MTAQDRTAALRERLAGLALPGATRASPDGIPCFDVRSKDVRTAVLRLRDACGFDVNTFVTAVDRFPEEPRFEVVWQFLSVGASAEGGSEGGGEGGGPFPSLRVRLRTRVPSSDPRVPSIADLFPGAAYPERECYDMFGVRFEGHVGLKRLMMPEGYGHHPLRKDFPHQGIEPDRLYREWDRRRHEKAARAGASEVLHGDRAPEVPTGSPDVRTPP